MYGLPTDFMGWMALLIVIGGGISIVLQWLNKDSNNRREATEEVKEDANRADDRLINLLKDQVVALERRTTDQDKKLFDQETQLKAMAIKIEAITKENTHLMEILQGRDQATQDYQAAGVAAMKRGEEIYKMMLTMSQSMTRLMEIIEQHLKRIEGLIHSQDMKTTTKENVKETVTTVVPVVPIATS